MIAVTRRKNDCKYFVSLKEYTEFLETRFSLFASENSSLALLIHSFIKSQKEEFDSVSKAMVLRYGLNDVSELILRDQNLDDKCTALSTETNSISVSPPINAIRSVIDAVIVPLDQELESVESAQAQHDRCVSLVNETDSRIANLCIKIAELDAEIELSISNDDFEAADQLQANANQLNIELSTLKDHAAHLAHDAELALCKLAAISNQTNQNSVADSEVL